MTLNEVHAPYVTTAKGCQSHARVPSQWPSSGAGVGDHPSTSAAVPVSLPFGLQSYSNSACQTTEVCFLHLGGWAKCVCHSPITTTVNAEKTEHRADGYTWLMQELSYTSATVAFNSKKAIKKFSE